jgi:3-oxoacyl-[acyl-carrier-protein] synthase-1
MSTKSLSIANTGLVTAVGLSAPAACAAIRAGVTNPTESMFMNTGGERIISHAVPMNVPRSGRARLARMTAMVIEECLARVPRREWDRIPLLLCVAEQSRPGRVQGLDDQFLGEVRELLHTRFDSESLVISGGRPGIGIALSRARHLLYDGGRSAALIVGTDSLIKSSTLSALEQEERLLTSRNSNGFIPGEGAAAVLLCVPFKGPRLEVVGLGFATESSHIGSANPLRADGLTRAIKGALADAACDMHDLDFRIADVSGEQYYFREAALALSRTLRRRKDRFDMWHPAECIGEAGSVIGPAMLAVADAACRKGYAPGPRILIHAGSDDGSRACIVVRHVS